MRMPLEIVLVRHGESEGNVASRRSKKGDHSAYTEEFRQRHNSLWRLTDDGIIQAKAAGKWLREHNLNRFDVYYVSAFLRAMETAAYLGLPDAEWKQNIYLREIGWGALDLMSHQERQELHAEEMKRKQRDGVYFGPLGGESEIDTAFRVDRVNDTLARECSDMSVCMVNHGTVINAFRFLFERLTVAQFQELLDSKDPKDEIHNCQIVHYSRRDPVTRKVQPHLSFVRSICPWNETLSTNEWREIRRPTFSNELLLALVNETKRLISG